MDDEMPDEMVYGQPVLHAHPGRAPLRLALTSMMGLPIFAPGQRCPYTPVATGKGRRQQLGTQ